MTVEKRGTSVKGDDEGGDNLGERMVTGADLVDDSVEKQWKGEGTWWIV